jgi:hypothetical protein
MQADSETKMGSICSNTKPPTSQLSWESYTREQAVNDTSDKKETTFISLEQLPENAEDVLSDIEQRGQQKAKEIMQSNDSSEIVANKLISFMQQGAEEFNTRTGRPMTYAEMRAAWG